LEKDMILALEDGSFYRGRNFGSRRPAVFRLTPDAGAVGYQELLTDPAVYGQGILFTYPLLGNYGVTAEDNESTRVQASAVVTRQVCRDPSNFRSIQSVSEWLEDAGVPGIEGVDTREISLKLWRKGSMKALLTEDMPPEKAGALLAESRLPASPVAGVSCAKRWYARTADHTRRITVVDLGVRMSLIRALNQAGCNVTVVPWNTPVETILGLLPQGVVFSDGPGDPRELTAPIRTADALLKRLPVLGIGLGCQVLGLAKSGRVEALPAGHFGVRPVKTAEGKVFTAAQHHRYTLTNSGGLRVTARDLSDGSPEAVDFGNGSFGVQFRGEEVPGVLQRFMRETEGR
jgi:carbamoyl-phosphate synthase small subunit